MTVHPTMLLVASLASAVMTSPATAEPAPGAMPMPEPVTGRLRTGHRWALHNRPVG